MGNMRLQPSTERRSRRRDARRRSRRHMEAVGDRARVAHAAESAPVTELGQSQCVISGPERHYSPLLADKVIDGVPC
jgi:hypothetical protein